MIRPLTYLSLLVGIFGSSHPNVPINGRIVGGEDANIEDYPYIVGLIDKYGYYCAGVLIDYKWVLTAAHCFNGPLNTISEYIQVQGGSSYINEGDIYTIKNVTIHPNYNTTNDDSDIALIELAEEIDCENCKPIHLTSVTPSKDDMVSIVGWGYTLKYNWTDPDYDGAPILQVGQVPIVDRDLCKQSYDPFNIELTNNMFCAGYWEEGGVDACTADAGGPVVSNKGVVGIISHGNLVSGCALPYFPSIHTLVTQYLDWIEEISRVKA